MVVCLFGCPILVDCWLLTSDTTCNPSSGATEGPCCVVLTERCVDVFNACMDFCSVVLMLLDEKPDAPLLAALLLALSTCCVGVLSHCVCMYHPMHTRVCNRSRYIYLTQGQRWSSASSLVQNGLQRLNRSAPQPR